VGNGRYSIPAIQIKECTKFEPLMCWAYVNPFFLFLKGKLSFIYLT
jgi:hypothetical protein